MNTLSKPLRIFTLIVVFGLLSCHSAFGEDKRHTIPLDHAVFLGPDDAPITIVEFLDFQ